MSIEQFGKYYFDPADIVLIDLDPLTPHRRDQKSNHYFVYIKNVPKPIILGGEDADNCLAAFLGGTEAVDKKATKKQKEDKND